jgi:hypothetical protein
MYKDFKVGDTVYFLDDKRLPRSGVIKSLRIEYTLKGTRLTGGTLESVGYPNTQFYTMDNIFADKKEMLHDLSRRLDNLS